MYEPDYYASTYEREGTEVFLTSGGERFAIHQEWADDFDDYGVVQDLFPLDGSRWHHIVAQSPLAPTVADYTALSRCIIGGTCDFRDNRINLVTTAGADGQSLEFVAVAATADVNPSKMSIGNLRMCFAKGEDVWLSLRVRTSGGLPGTLVDLESTFLYGSGGPRIVIFGGSLAVQLKFADKPIYAQETPRPWPADQWVAVKLHLRPDEAETGLIQLWQDDELVIDTTGRTLPLADIVLDSLEVGISATQVPSRVEVDDLRVSRSPL